MPALRIQIVPQVFHNAGSEFDDDDELRNAEEQQEKQRSKLMMRIVSRNRQRETDCVYERLSNMRTLAVQADQRADFVDELWNRLAKLCGHDTIGDGTSDDSDDDGESQIYDRGWVSLACVGKPWRARSRLYRSQIL